ncbi:transcriptional regulator [Streptomyces amritsarensis]|uniref:Transcriptional regulator n=1 Tax=Streptomyces amritsarensis TaxID=681158 RepID=A0ABX3G641_9ACTN|nr:MULTISPECIES: helix-turn-helix transcriptional regulator [Streptomyces]OLZ70228.1 transcriptional regulator [Streptomyces amritsarensis]
MVTRPVATARRARLGAELRKLRERAGMTAAEAATAIGTSSGQLSNVESARFGVSPDRVRAMARVYSVCDPQLVDALAAMAADRTNGWWDQYREVLPPSLLDLAELEHHALTLRAACTAHVPGLLQTADHAREVFRQVVPELTPPEVEHRVSHRIKRQDVLYRSDPIPYTAIIHEAALRMQFGGRAVVKGQLAHLMEMGQRSQVRILVIPFDAGSFPGAGQSIYYAHGPVPQLDTVHLDQSHGPALVDAEARLDGYRLLLDHMETMALGREESSQFIHSILRTL